MGMIVLRFPCPQCLHIMAQPSLLLFPTHYLGNLVLGLPWVLRVLEREAAAVAVFDEAFRPLLGLLPQIEGRALYYPRKQLGREHPFRRRLSRYIDFLGELRKHRGHCLIDLEGERFSGVLARLSGCRRRIGPEAKRAQWFYSEVLALDYLAHRFNAFGEILGACGSCGGGAAPASKLDFRVTPELAGRITRRLGEHSIGRPLAVIHPGASVSYKLWPRAHFARLVTGLFDAGLQPVWIGAGQFDAEVIAGIEGELAQSPAISFCNELGLAELIALFRQSRLFIGCDSGPMHLAAATGLPVFALFGPSREAIWAPLGQNSTVLRGIKPCASDCDAWRCRNDYHCLRSLAPDRVLGRILELHGETNTDS